MNKEWQVHKFGGTSLQDAACFVQVQKIVANESECQKKAIVVSAMGGMTDALFTITKLAAKRDRSYLGKLENIYHRLICTLEELLPDHPNDTITKKIEASIDDIRDILRSTYLMRECSEASLAYITGFGELWSAQILHAYLNALDFPAIWLNARKVLFTEPGETGSVVRWEMSQAAFDSWLTQNETDLLVITGFIASRTDGTPTTLGRNGSDFSASIFGSILNAKLITIWTDVDGVLSADPNKVKDAQVLAKLSYHEAMELSYFGAKVLHPHTIEPARRKEIPIKIRNSRNLAAKGTTIHTISSDNEDIENQLPITGLTTVDHISLINVEGSNLMGVPGIAQRVFGALSAVKVSVIMISQASSEHSICFAVPESQGPLAHATLEKTFINEKAHDHVQTIDIVESCCVLAAVGNRMREKVGVAARFFESIGNAGINIRAISQGSSEQNISVVIDQADSTRALQAVHSAFYLSKQTLSIGLIGAGLIGSTLIEQIQQESADLHTKFNINLRIRGIMTSKRMYLSDNIALEDWRSLLADRGVAQDIHSFVNFIQTDSLPHTVLIDCTASAEIATHYPHWIKQGIHIITPNKRAGSSDMNSYNQLRNAARRLNTHFLYEATVGAGLPIITTLRDLIHTGDKITKIEGIFSGTLSYLFNNFHAGIAFSEVLKKAMEQGFTEPDPREDLSGMDVVRKVMILAREMGTNIELDDILVQNLVPPKLQALNKIDDFFDQISLLDSVMAAQLEEATSQGQVLRYIGSFDNQNQATVALKSIPQDHPFAHTRGSDNIIAFTTARYNETPLIIQGPGAGPNVTAGGIFADILRLTNYLGAAT